MSPVILTHAEGFRLDFDSMQRDTLPLTGGEFAMEGGLAPQEAHGVASTMRDQAIETTGGCGNGVREDGEWCDGSDLASATCEQQGFIGGTIACTAACTLDTSACTMPELVFTTGGESTAGQAGGGARSVTSLSRSAPSSASVASTPEARSSSAPIAQNTSSASSQRPVSPVAAITHERTTGTDDHASEAQASTQSEATSSETTEPESAVASSAVALGAEGTWQMRGDGSREPAERQEGAPTQAATPEAIARTEGMATPFIGGATVIEAGAFGRLAWIAYVKNLYAAIPAYESASVPFSGLLSGMRPGAVSVSALVPPFLVPPVRRKRKRTTFSDNA